MENFINDFKIYCESVEDITGLEIVQRWVINTFYCLDTFVGENYNICNDDAEEGIRLSMLLYELANKAKDIKVLDKKDIWKSFEMADIKDFRTVKDIMTETLVEACEFLCNKYNLGYDDYLTEEIVNKEKWYKELCLLDDKYFSDVWVEIE